MPGTTSLPSNQPPNNGEVRDDSGAGNDGFKPLYMYIAIAAGGLVFLILAGVIVFLSCKQCKKARQATDGEKKVEEEQEENENYYSEITVCENLGYTSSGEVDRAAGKEISSDYLTLAKRTE